MKIRYLKRQNSILFTFSLVCLFSATVSAGFAGRAVYRAKEAERALEVNSKLNLHLSQEVDELKDQIQALDQQCEAQYDMGWVDAEWEMFGDPPYEEWSC